MLSIITDIEDFEAWNWERWEDDSLCLDCTDNNLKNQLTANEATTNTCICNTIHRTTYLLVNLNSTKPLGYDNRIAFSGEFDLVESRTIDFLDLQMQIFQT